MKEKKIPLRMCIVTKQMLPKTSLVRIVRTKENEFKLDKTGKINGRGAYVTNSLEAIERLCKTKALNRAFKKDISNKTYNEILEQYIANIQQKN